MHGSMKRYVILVSLVFVFIATLSGNTGPTLANDQSLKLPILVQQVLDRNPDLAAAQLRIDSAAHVIPRVQQLDDPEFTFRTMNNPIGSKRDFDKELHYKISQKIPFPGKLYLRGEVAKRAYDFLVHEEITTAQELVLQTKRLHFLLFFNRTALDINKQNRDITKRLIGGAVALYRSGTGSQADMLKGEVELQLLDDELLRLEADQQTLIALINVLLDRPQKNPLGEPEVIFYHHIKFTYELLEPIAMLQRPELHSLASKVEEEQTKARLARQEYYPDFTVMFMVQDKPNQDKRAWGVDFGFNLPIFINQKQKQELLEAEAQAMAHQHSLYWTQAQIRGRIKELLAKFYAVDERIALYKTGLVPKSIETLASHEWQYRVGKTDFLTVLDSRRQLQNIELDYEKARIEREILLAELERAIGVPLEHINDSLNSIRTQQSRAPQSTQQATSTQTAVKNKKTPMNKKTPIKKKRRRSLRKTRNKKSRKEIP